MLSSSELDLAGHAHLAREVTLDMEDQAPADDLISEFSARFAASFRQRAADAPAAVRPLDVVDVFAEGGDFVCRGVVESVDGVHAIVKASTPRSDSPHRARLENCRHASAGPLPCSLAEWEETRR